MLHITFDPTATKGEVTVCDRLRFTKGTTEFTITGEPDGITITKVDHKDPLNEPVKITPVHTNKIKIT